MLGDTHGALHGERRKGPIMLVFESKDHRKCIACECPVPLGVKISLTSSHQETHETIHSIWQVVSQAISQAIRLSGLQTMYELLR